MIQYRLFWARTNLKGIGAVKNSAGGVWAITEKGASLSPEEVQAQVKAWFAEARAKRLARKGTRAACEADVNAAGEDDRARS